VIAIEVQHGALYPRPNIDRHATDQNIEYWRGETFMQVCTPVADAVGLERVRYFPRQLISDDDMTQAQTYFLSKMRRHNRLLHGWGVVCGVGVRRGKGASEIVIEPGYVLGPNGDEIIINDECTVDLTRESLDGDALQSCGEPLDAWCRDAAISGGALRRMSGTPRSGDSKRVRLRANRM
jgi:hypothetical protein